MQNQVEQAMRRMVPHLSLFQPIYIIKSAHQDNKRCQHQNATTYTSFRKTCSIQTTEKND